MTLGRSANMKIEVFVIFYFDFVQIVNKILLCRLKSRENPMILEVIESAIIFIASYSRTKKKHLNVCVLKCWLDSILVAAMVNDKSISPSNVKIRASSVWRFVAFVSYQSHSESVRQQFIDDTVIHRIKQICYFFWFTKLFQRHQGKYHRRQLHISIEST